MGTIKRRKRVSHRELGPYKRYELLTGWIDYVNVGYTGYGDAASKYVSEFISDEMRADWAANREELLKFWASGESLHSFFPDTPPWQFVRNSPGTLPWAERVLSVSESAESQR